MTFVALPKRDLPESRTGAPRRCCGQSGRRILNAATIPTLRAPLVCGAAVGLEPAEAASFDVHPVYGHRGAAIIESLVREGWAG